MCRYHKARIITTRDVITSSICRTSTTKNLRKLVKLMELVRLRKLIKLMELVEKVKLMEIVKLRRCRPTSL